MHLAATILILFLARDLQNHHPWHKVNKTSWDLKSWPSVSSKFGMLVHCLAHLSGILRIDNPHNEVVLGVHVTAQLAFGLNESVAARGLRALGGHDACSQVMLLQCLVVFLGTVFLVGEFWSAGKPKLDHFLVYDFGQEIVLVRMGMCHLVCTMASIC